MMQMSPFAFYLVLGIALVSAELLIFQLSVFWLLFVGLGALVAALIAWLLGTDSWLIATAVFVAATVLIAGLAYRPLRRWQQKPALLAGHDALGQTVSVVKRIEAGRSGLVVWSGTKWSAVLAPDQGQALEAGARAEITGIDGIVLTVQAIDPGSA